MDEREPFLKAIFANPSDDLPRLVFADWLDEHGETIWAELIRVQCELHTLCRTIPELDEVRLSRLYALMGRSNELQVQMHPEHAESVPSGFESDRGFVMCERVCVSVDALRDRESFRQTALDQHPEWYGARSLKISGGCITSPEPLATILTSPVLEHVTDLDLSGLEVGQRDIDLELEFEAKHPDMDVLWHPQPRTVINPRMVNHLAWMRESCRLIVLDLRNNELDNDALRSLAESPHLNQLRTLRLSEGNRFRGRVWQRVLERFGEDVVE